MEKEEERKRDLLRFSFIFLVAPFSSSSECCIFPPLVSSSFLHLSVFRLSHIGQESASLKFAVPAALFLVHYLFWQISLSPSLFHISLSIHIHNYQFSSFASSLILQV